MSYQIKIPSCIFGGAGSIENVKAVIEKENAKKVIILETDKILVNDNTKDTPITVTLKAFAKEDPTKVVVFRKAVFIYPRLDKLQQ